MYAVIETGGRQYKVREGDILRVERLKANVGDEIELGQVLLLAEDGNVRIGRPKVENVKVLAEVLAHDRAKKVLVFKYKPKKNYRRRYGHRQPYTQVRIQKIAVEGGEAAAPIPEDTRDLPAL